MIAAEVNRAQRSGSPQRPVRKFVEDFRGLAGTQKRGRICGAINAWRESLDTYFAKGDDAIRRLLVEMKAQSNPVKPRDLGLLGEEHVLEVLGGDPESSRYKRVDVDVAGVPYLTECGFAYRGGSGGRTMVTGLNWSAAVGGNPFREVGSGLESILTEQRCGSAEPISLFLHVASPRLAFLDRGKKTVALPYWVNTAVVAAIRHVTAQWTKQRKSEERDRQARLRRDDAMHASRPMSKKEAAYQVMAWAYAKASTNGTLPANARQIYYAARSEVMRLAEAEDVRSGDFTQRLLVGYMNDHPEECASWDVVFDDRGHLVEPHTKRVVGLGTLAVRDYVGGYMKPALLEGGFTKPKIETQGPEGRFGGVLYVEKEGFDPLLEQARIAERFDLAVMSCKGMSVTAARKLIDATCARFKVPLYILHDFDISGFSIAATLHTSNSRFKFNTVSGEDFKVVDFGLRLDDVERLDLASERVVIDPKDKTAIRRRLEINGAKPEEIDFLLSDRRVELNAMTSREFLDFLEEKLTEHSVGKVVPDSRMLADAYRLFTRGKRARQVVEEALAAMSADDSAAPPDIEKRVRDYLTENPDASWDDAVEEIVDDDDAEGALL